MPNFSAYELYLCDWTGAQIALVSGPELVSFSWQLLLNDAGVCRCELVAEVQTKDLFKQDYGLRLMRDYGAGMYEEFYGFHLNSEEWISSGDVDQHLWASIGLSPEWMLDQPLLQPTMSLNPDFYSYDIWWMYGPADDVMKLMVYESMGGGAYASRQFSYLGVEGNKSEGKPSSYEARYERLLEVLQSIAGDISQVDFRVVRLDGGGFEFKTYYPFYGTDRRKGHSDKPTVFSLEMENIIDPKIVIQGYPATTTLYGGWQGGGSARDIFIRTNATAEAETPFRRREVFMDVRDLAQADNIYDILDQALIDQGKQEIITFTPIQTSACLYGRDWNLGDLVTAEIWDRTFDVRITEVDGKISGDNEEEIQGKAETWTRAESV